MYSFCDYSGTVWNSETLQKLKTPCVETYGLWDIDFLEAIAMVETLETGVIITPRSECTNS